MWESVGDIYQLDIEPKKTVLELIRRLAIVNGKIMLSLMESKLQRIVIVRVKKKK